MKTIPVEVLKNQREAEGIYRLVLEPQKPLDRLDPGCFFMVRVSPGSDPLLRRPLGVFGVSAGGIELLYQVRGKGTRLLSKMRPGEETDIIGPLGRGWRRMDSARHILLLAGGVGMAPLHDLAVNLRDFGDQRPVTLVWGHRDKSTVCCLDKLHELDLDVLLVTEDGSMGLQGMVTDHLDEARARASGKPVQAAACGPMPMLKKAALFFSGLDISCQVSLEALMGCGMGACLTCVVPAKGGGHLRVCREGPVFYSQEIDWEALK